MRTDQEAKRLAPGLARIAKEKDLFDAARERLTRSVDQAKANGATWEEIADTLGVTRQAAWDRFH